MRQFTIKDRVRAKTGCGPCPLADEDFANLGGHVQARSGFLRLNRSHTQSAYSKMPAGGSARLRVVWAPPSGASRSALAAGDRCAWLRRLQQGRGSPEQPGGAPAGRIAGRARGPCGPLALLSLAPAVVPPSFAFKEADRAWMPLLPCWSVGSFSPHKLKQRHITSVASLGDGAPSAGWPITHQCLSSPTPLKR